MTNTTYLDKLKGIELTKIQLEVFDRLKEKSSCDLDIEECLQYVYCYWCVSWSVESMIYYRDTSRFYEAYKDDINEMIYEYLDVCWCHIDEAFYYWDKTDPLAFYRKNQTTLVHFAFEQAAFEIAQILEIEF